MLVVMQKLRWYHRLYHRVRTLLGRECYAGEVIDTTPWRQEVDKMFLCPGCWKYQSWDNGCAHEKPELSRLCDDCFVTGGHASQ